MSLVLNTNKSGGGGYKISNEQILGIYPDFENALLLTFPFVSGDNFTNVRNEEALSVNGTKINRFCKNIVAPEFFKVNPTLVFGGANYIGFAPTIYVGAGSGNATTPYTCRFGLPGQFKGGEVIGKEIIFPEFMHSPYAPDGIKTLQLKVGLLHTDGTITYMADYTNRIGGTVPVDGYAHSSQRSNSRESIYYTNKFHQKIITEGFVAQEGDYLIYEMTVVGTSGGSSTTVYLYFGSPYPVNEYGIQYPIQVSID